ncbi:THAP domain-containing protein 2-like, partial [Melanaphis sacchari]|uniref:THAP domain-containing protein 2-like n=1 Tax=Melanaphis sacchari TaxID=742174 RepID=UPI000DC14BFA
MPTYHNKKNFNLCVVCCKSTKKGFDISLHKFPKKQARREIWLKNCGLVEKDIKSYTKLCSSHFEKDCVILTGIRRVLTRSAVPVIFEENIKHKKKQKKNKKTSQHSPIMTKTGDQSLITRSYSKVYFILVSDHNLVQNSIPTATVTHGTQISRQSEAILQTQVDDLENPAANVIPMWTLCQFTAQLT